MRFGSDGAAANRVDGNSDDGDMKAAFLRALFARPWRGN
jgi:hypothetical protein